MTTITLEVPDELAAQLKTLPNGLPALLAEALREQHLKTPRASVIYPVYREMLDFLAGSPTPKQLLAFRLSRPAQERLADLLDKNREQALTAEETAELDAYELVHHSVIRLKANSVRTEKSMPS